jgi:hypothetical protein
MDNEFKTVEQLKNKIFDVISGHEYHLVLPALTLVTASVIVQSSPETRDELALKTADKTLRESVQYARNYFEAKSIIQTAH